VNLRPFLFSALFFIGFAASCRTLETKPQTPPDVEAWFASLAARSRAVRAVEAEGKIEYIDEKGRHDRGRLLWTVERPDRAAFEVLGPTGLVAAATIDGLEFRYFDARTRRLLFGPATAKTLRAHLPWPIGPEELVPLLLGTPAIRQGVREDAIFDDETKRWQVATADPQGQWRQTIWFDGDGRLYRVRLITPEPGPRFEATFLGWKSFGSEGIAYPGFVKIQQFGGEAKVTLKLSGRPPAFNKIYSPSTFRLPFPEGAPARRIESE